MKKPDHKTTLTGDDLPGLRAQLLGFLGEEGFSEPFRIACATALEAIDEAVAADAAINARLQLALEAWVVAADTEVAA